MIITAIILQITCTSVILYHMYRIEDNLDVQLKDLRHFQNHTSQSVNRVEDLLDEVNSTVIDIEEIIGDSRKATEE